MIIKYFFDLLIPHKLRNDVVYYANAKAMVGLGLVAIPALLISALFHYSITSSSIAYIIVSESGVILFALILMRITASLFIAREIIVFSMVLFLTYGFLKLGGFNYPGIYWFVLPPLVALLTGGFFSGIFWGIVDTFVLVCLYFYTKDLSVNLYFPPILRLYSSITLIYVVFSIAYISEKGKINGLKLRYRAYHDVLTGLLNRFTFEDKLHNELKLALTSHKRLILIKIDVDNFGSVNDTLGYEVGDVLLKEIAQRLVNHFPDSCVARLGNDEFGVLLHYTSNVDITLFLDNMQEELRKPHAINIYHELNYSCSIGVAFYPDDAKQFSSLLRYTNLALAYAKYLNGNNIQYFHEKMAEEDSYRLAIQSYLPYALERNEFFLHYQPKFLASNNHHLVGMEVLLRWKNPILGSVSPAIFIPIAEQMGLISEIGDWILLTSLNQYKIWENRNLFKNELTLAVNFSIHQLRRANLFEIISNSISKNEVNPHCLEIEITESIFMDEKEHIISVIKQLRKLGVLITLDDFGTGFSSLGYLSQIPLDILKIDKIFVDQLVEDKRMVTTIIKLAHQFNLKVVAEGVENKDQLEILNSINCDYIQGFYLSKPLSTLEIEYLFLEKLNGMSRPLNN